MDPKENPQSEAPEMSPETEVPQAPPAAPSGPDHLRLPPNPLAQQQEQGRERDWKKSFDGLMSKYQEEKREWNEQFNKLAQRLDGLEQVRPQAPSPSPDKEAQEQAPEEPGREKDNALYERVVELEAERHRDKLLLEMTEPGQPGHRLPLMRFAENIPLVPPTIGEDGSIDDSGQREAIVSFITKVKESVSGRAQSSAAGWTPGASPQAPRPQTEQEKEAEYYRLKELYGSEEYAQLDPAEQDKISKRYYELQNEIGWDLPGQTMPWADQYYQNEQVRRLMRRMGALEDQIKL